MPELNLEALKKIKKVENKYRPYDTSFISPNLNESIKKSKESLEVKKSENRFKPSLELKSFSSSNGGKDYFSINGHSIYGHDLFLILKKINCWDLPTIGLFVYLLEKTQFGKLENVQIGRREFEENAINSRYFSDSRKKLVNSNIITFSDGYIDGTKKMRTFYSLNLDAFSEFLASS